MSRWRHIALSTAAILVLGGCTATHALAGTSIALTPTRTSASMPITQTLTTTTACTDAIKTKGCIQVQTVTVAGSPSGSDCGWANPFACAHDVITKGIGDMINSVGNHLSTWITQLLQPLAILNIWTATPAALTYAYPGIVSLWKTMLIVADVLVGLWLCIMFMGRAKDGALGRPVEPVGQVLSHTLTTVALAHLSLFVIGYLVDIANSVSVSIGLTASQNILTMLVELIIGSVSDGAFLAMLGAAGPIGWAILIALPLIKLTVLILIGVQMLRRIALLDLCIVLAPIGFMSAVWVRTAPWSKIWHSHFWPALLSQSIQVVTLTIGLKMSDDISNAIDTGINSMALGQSAGQSVIHAVPIMQGLIDQGAISRGLTTAIAMYLMQSLLGIALLFTALKVPSLLSHDLGRVLGHSNVTAGSLVKNAATLAAKVWHSPTGGPFAMAALQQAMGQKTAGKAESAGQSIFGAPRYTQRRDFKQWAGDKIKPRHFTRANSPLPPQSEPSLDDCSS